ncbi:phosphatidylglycerophosphatase A [Paucidesulfovibrio gracilis DSM 16080]|uniref:Phosphatidylglycerophosphatase A n=1 Tax=Paucidesulfovibrio gracilis DSM 16080 TaxID=1121449 RepID=A0A1T4WJY4_9BACT|nr:phosphatidylglycerophosphatase A [Paucidesulfovibrio gracilis]SKA77666.1 phosphatidylglycerophosphatase A [Paucidesulfovibrio gracilis DSM 16080]
MSTFLNRCSVTLATLGPVGRIPMAPGTWGSAAALLLAPFLFVPLPMGGRLALLLPVLVIGVWASGRAEQVLKATDPGCIVIDELLGQWVALLPVTVPTLVHYPRLWEYALAFGLFRLFDILKPFPIRRVERLFPGGFGVMLDDLMAGLYAAAALTLLPKLANAIGLPLP